MISGWFNLILTFPQFELSRASSRKKKKTWESSSIAPTKSGPETMTEIGEFADVFCREFR